MPVIHSRLGVARAPRSVSLAVAAALSLSVVGAAVPALAGIRSGTLSLDPFVGAYVFNRNEDRFAHYFGLRAGLNFTPHVGAEATLGYFPRSQATIFNPNEVDLPADAYRFGVDALIHLFPAGPIVPFLAAGVGNLSVAYPAAGRNRHLGWFDYGVGLKAFVARDVALRADIRHFLFSTEGSTRSNLDFSLGLTLLFGGSDRRGPDPLADSGQIDLR